MRLLTATARGQGERDNDFNWCIEGELVMVPMLVCAKDADDPDGGCGCGRGFPGLTSHRATTTAVVRDLPNVSESEYVEVIRMSLEDQGWGGEHSVQMAELMLELAAKLPIDTVIERRLDIVQVRELQLGQGR